MSLDSGDGRTWRPTASLTALRQRALLLSRAREYFHREGVLEVETPALSSAGSTDLHLHSFRARSLAPRDNTERYLHTSPEFAMKRLLAAGSGSIYQISKAFRAGEIGRRHNPEFTMLEWYRVGMGYRELMRDVETLVRHAIQDLRSLAETETLSYREAFERHADLNPHTASADDFARAARDRGIDASGISPSDRTTWRDLVLTHLVEPHLGKDRLTFLFDYPADAATLARVRRDSTPVAERFELYWYGVELANGFQELSDPAEQRARFERDQQLRQQNEVAMVPKDERLLAALASGLPECSGVALGFDRLVMLAVGATSLDEVIAFPADRA